jgi:hypothetical protein
MTSASDKRAGTITSTVNTLFSIARISGIIPFLNVVSGAAVHS